MSSSSSFSSSSSLLFCTLWDFEDENEDEDEDEPTRGHPLFCILYPPRPMTLLPIAERELRVASRRRGTYWLRSMLGLTSVKYVQGTKSLAVADATLG